MSYVNTDSPAPLQQPASQLPPGWRHTDELERADDFHHAGLRRRRRLVVVGLSAMCVAAVAAAVALLLLGAGNHYAQGLSALERGDYAAAVAELSQADVLGVPYRDASVLTGQAQRQLSVQIAGSEQARALVAEVHDALAQGAAAFADGSAAGVQAALASVAAADLKSVLAGDTDSRQAAAALAADVKRAGGRALAARKWDQAAGWAAALLVLRPKSDAAAGLAAEAKLGRRLSEQFAAAKAAAGKREWRKALRLALAVRAADAGFPGVAGIVADAKQALKPKPKPKPAPAAATTVVAPSTTTTGTSSGGSSSGSSSQPPPP